MPACADGVQAVHFDRFVFKSDNKIREEKKLFPALCWDIKYICWLNTRPSANDGSTSVWGVLDVFKHPILTRLD